jgi:hypothetical protein
MILEGAGRHKASSLKGPGNMRLIPLPPYAPELNPVEHLRDELREKSFGNLVFQQLGRAGTSPGEGVVNHGTRYRKSQIHRRPAMDYEFTFDLELE